MKRKKVEPITLDELMDEMFNLQVLPKPPNAFSIDDVKKKTGYGRAGAEALINKKIENGEIKKIKCRDNGKVKIFYVPVKKKSTKKKCR